VWFLSGLRVRDVLEAVAKRVSQVGIVSVFFSLVLEIVSFFFVF